MPVKGDKNESGAFFFSLFLIIKSCCSFFNKLRESNWLLVEMPTETTARFTRSTRGQLPEYSPKLLIRWLDYKHLISDTADNTLYKLLLFKHNLKIKDQFMIFQAGLNTIFRGHCAQNEGCTPCPPISAKSCFTRNCAEQQKLLSHAFRYFSIILRLAWEITLKFP